jgi:SPP1 family predicted phage head-tail adaptor
MELLMVRAGELNRRIDWQASSQVRSSSGGFTVTWTTVVASCAAAIWPVSAKEQLQNGVTTAEATHRIRIRYRHPFSGSWRGKHGDRYFAIVSVIDPNEAHEVLDLLCKEVQA